MVNQNKAMISVVIPAHNEEKFIADCLYSLLDQDYTGEYELLVCDNCSTDRTAEIARSVGVRVISCPDKKSVFYARQVGADTAKGDIIAQADADTIYPPDWVSRIAMQFERHPKAVAVAGRFAYMDPPSWCKVEYALRNGINLLCARKLTFSRPMLIAGASFAFRREPFVKGGGYEGILYGADQYGLAGRLRKFGPIVYDPKMIGFTSSRSVAKPFKTVLKDVGHHIHTWWSYWTRLIAQSAVACATRTTKRRFATASGTMAIIFLAFVCYGYFVPASPVFGKVYYKGSPEEKVIALTFDDGPNEPYTSQILDVLARYDIDATFFCISKNVETYPDVARRILEEGSVIGNHSATHDANHALSEFGAKDMYIAQIQIYDILGIYPHLYRPPHGKKTPWELAEVKNQGLIAVNWSRTTNEIGIESPDDISVNIIKKVKPGDIILLHDGYGTEHNTARADKSFEVQALIEIIEALQAQGYQFVTVPELLGTYAYIEQ